LHQLIPKTATNKSGKKKKEKKDECVLGNQNNETTFVYVSVFVLIPFSVFYTNINTFCKWKIFCYVK